MKADGRQDTAVDRRRVLRLADQLTAAAGCVFALAMILAVISLRCLYADGSFYLLKVLEAGNFAAITNDRYCATFSFELPVVAAIKLGVTNLHALTLAFGVGCFLAWPVSLALCRRLAPRHFWLALAGCGAGYLNSGFMPVGEYNVAHALFWPTLFVLLYARPLGPWPAAVLIGGALMLVFSYESLLFLGPPLTLLAAGRAAARGEKAWARGVLALAALLLLLAAAVALGSVLHPQSPNNYGGFRRGLLEILRAPTWTMLWTGVWVGLAVGVCLSGKGFTTAHFGVEKALFGWVILVWAAGPWLHPADIGAGRGYELRSLQLLVPLALLVPAWLATRHPDWFEQRRPYLICFSASLLLAQSLWLAAATWQWNGFVGTWRGVLASHRGPVALAETPFAAAAADGQALSFEWTWANPTLSLLLSPRQQVQSMILPGYKTPWQPFDPLKAEALPRLQRYGVVYDAYLEGLAGRSLTNRPAAGGKAGPDGNRRTGRELNNGE